MRESVLRDFIRGEVSIISLVEDVRNSTKRVSEIEWAIYIADMEDAFCFRREHAIALCDAALSNALAPEDLTAIAFALLASDRFEWDDDVISEVLSDWACPEVTGPVVEGALKVHRIWLTGEADAPGRIAIPGGEQGDLISVRKKISSSEAFESNKKEA
jgi:hypothetical protein